MNFALSQRTYVVDSLESVLQVRFGIVQTRFRLDTLVCQIQVFKLTLYLAVDFARLRHIVNTVSCVDLR